MEGDHSFHTGSGEVGDRTWQVDQVVRCGNGVMAVVVVEAAAQCVRTNNCHGGRTECDQTAVGSGKSG
jgi:hypothetical protein